MQTIDRALGLLRFFTIEHPEISLNDLAELSGFDKPKTRRYLLALVLHGFVEQNTRRTYRVGPGGLRIAKVYDSVFRVESSTMPALKKLRDQTKLAAHYSTLTGSYMSIIHLAASGAGGEDDTSIKEGNVLPLHASAAGLVVLAYAQIPLQESVLSKPLKKNTRYTLSEKSKLRPLLRHIGADGYYHSSRTFHPQLECLACPVFNSKAMPIGAISVIIPAGTKSKAQIKSLAGNVARAAVDATRKMGGEPHEILLECLSGGSH